MTFEPDLSLDESGLDLAPDTLQPIAEAESETTQPNSLAQTPAGVRSTPVVGLVMLIVGLLVGYLARPTVEAKLFAPSKASLLPRTSAELMPYLIKNTRHFKGDPNAAAVLIEFSDFQCPYCGHFVAETASKIDSQYMLTGKVRIGYQHFTFLGLGSQQAAEASECAAEQNAFWQYHDLLFASQGGGFNPERLKGFAVSLGLDAAKFNQCLDSGKYTSLVISQTEILQAMGVNSTPSFVLNGEPLVGALSFDKFQSLIERALELSAS